MLTLDEIPACAVRIESESAQCQGTQLWINGERMRNVTSISLAIGVDGRHRLVVEIVPDKLEVSGTFDVTTLDSTAREYRRGPWPNEPEHKF